MRIGINIRTVPALLITLFLVSTLTLTPSFAQDSAVYMYWADHGNDTNKIRRANLDGTNVQDIATGFGRPVGIALDIASGKIYWTDRDNVDFRNPNGRNSICRMNLDGTNIETLITGGPSVKEAIALDTAGGKMYWVDWNTFTGTGKIQRANLNGTNVEDVVPELVDPRGIALDLSQGKMYWTDGGAGKIQRANLDGENIEDLVTGLDNPTYIALDFNSGKLYWTDWTSGKVQRANFDGSNVEDLVVGLGHAAGIALDSLNGKMYWTHWFTNFQGSKIQRANLDGSNVEDLVTGFGLSVGIALGIPQAPAGLRFDPNTIADQTFTVGTHASLNLPVATGGTALYTYTLTPEPPAGLRFDARDRWIGGTPTTPIPATTYTYTATDTAGLTASLTFTITVQETPSLTDAYMYWASWGLSSIQRAKLDGTNLQNLVTGLTWPRDVALDIVGNKMYWVDAGANKVQRANLDGSNVEDLVNTQGQPFGVAVDTTNGKLYWSTWNPGKIRRANLDGTNVEDFVTGLSEPEDIDLDLSRGKIYWTDTVTNKIQRANLDGTNIEDLVTTGLSHPLGLTLDVLEGKIYWTNSSFHTGPWPGLDKIQRANLDGTNVEDLVTTGLVAASGIDLDLSDGKMYWTDIVTNKIQRANLDGSSVEDVIVSSANALINPNSLAIGIPQTPGLRFDPNMIADQTFTVGTSVSLNLPMATGDSPPYTYSTSALPPGLHFDPIDRWLNGTPTTVVNAHPVTYTATDAIGTSASLTFTITVELNLDVNGNGRVDVLDLVWVAVSYGMRGDALPADVNADGVVNIQDLVAVAEGIDAGAVLPEKVAEEVLFAAEAAAAELEGIPGAPVIGFSRRADFTAYGNVAAVLADAKHLASRDVRLGKWLPLLEGLLQALAELRAIPETTALLPNYPNPFNPETWIPYHLAMDAEVTLTIYNVRGSTVRELRLGHQPAGVYENRGRAAYWDGKNQHGEKVASGVYFYALTAGKFTATRKLLIRK